MKESNVLLSSPTSSDDSSVMAVQRQEASDVVSQLAHSHSHRRPLSPLSPPTTETPRSASHFFATATSPSSGFPRANLLERASSGSTAVSSSCGSKHWQRSSGRYDVPRMVGREATPISPASTPVVTTSFCDHDPGRWHTTSKEADDYLHDATIPDHLTILSARGCVNIMTLVSLALAIVMLFMGYPVLVELYFDKDGKHGGFGLGGTNATGQVPDLGRLGFRSDLIDRDTPKSALIKTGFGRNEDESWNLQWSDEFETDGRSFYPGDDPFWEAVNLYAHGTADYEWYDPAAVTTRNGSLVITCNEQDVHNLRFRSGQLTSWNQFCYTGGYLEAAVVLPGSPRVSGWWPAIWTMGNLGRANYGATTEGMWPYSYDTCDIGALINQTYPDGSGPPAALSSGAETGFNDKWKIKSLSYAPGQRLSACTCPGEDHPGPLDKHGNFRGRSAPEIDLFEAQVDGHLGGTLSLSGQFMPTNAGYWLNNATGTETEFYEIGGRKVELNSYRGNLFQQSASAIVVADQESYELTGNVFSVWGFEYEPGDDGYITWWINGKKAWTLHASSVGPDLRAQISQRPIPYEPMYIIINLAISSGFGYVDWDKMTFPAKMKIDYLRLYQAKGKENIGCDPKEFPTKDYIERHKEAYTNPNLTVWGGTPEEGGFGQIWPRQRPYDDGNGCNVEQRRYPGHFRPQGDQMINVNAAMQDPSGINPQ